MSSPRITVTRQIVQAVLIIAALLLPFVTVGGNPFLRMDIGLRTLFLAGVPVRIDQFYLVLLSTLFVVAVFLLITAVLGRVWCGWLCPQTVFNDLQEIVAGLFRRAPRGLAVVIEHAAALSISAAISFNLFCWFMAPARAAVSLGNPVANPLLTACFALVSLGGYLNLILVKRSFCSSYCPYGRFQAALTDQATLNLAFLEGTSDRCLQCGACVRTCPMGIDIRQGFQIECISCGRCIDACRDVMDRCHGGEGLIDYCFGTARGTRFIPGKKTVVLTLLTASLAVVLVWGVMGRSQAAFVVQRIATAEARMLPDGSMAQPWRAIIGNRTESPSRYSLRIEAGKSGDARLLGPVDDILIAPNEHRDIMFLISLRPQTAAAPPLKLQLFCSGRLLTTVRIHP